MEDDLQWKTTFIGRWPQIWQFEYLNKHWSDLPQILDICSWDHSKVKKVPMKTTFNGRRPLMEDDLKIRKFEYLSSHCSNFPQILNIGSGEQSRVKKSFNEDNLQCKTTCNGRWLQNMKIWISQQPLIESSSNFTHMLMRSNQSQKRFRWRQAPMEDELQSKVR